MSCMRRDKRVIVEREGEAKKSHHLPKGASSSSQGFKRIQADNASINVFLGKLKPYHTTLPPNIDLIEM